MGQLNKPILLQISIEGLRYRLNTDSIDLNESALHIESHLGWLYFLPKSQGTLVYVLKGHITWYPVKLSASSIKTDIP